MYWFRAAQSSSALLGSLTVATASSVRKPEEYSLFWTRAKIRLLLGLCCATNARISTRSPEDSMKLSPWAEWYTADPNKCQLLQLSLKMCDSVLGFAGDPGASTDPLARSSLPQTVS